MSSTMVSVLSPHWGGCLRRNKRGGSVTQDATTGDPTVSPANNTAHEQLLRYQSAYHHHHHGETGSVDGSQADERSPRLGNGWSSKSGPPSLTMDYSTPRGPVIQPLWAVGLRELDNRDLKGSTSNPEGSTAPLPFTDSHAHGRISQASCQGELSPARSTPTTTSGMPLSLRRLNYNWRYPSQAAEPLTCDGISSESAATVNSPDSEHSQGSFISRNARAYPAPSFTRKQTSLTSGLEREKDCKKSAETTNPVVSETSVGHRLSQYERYAFMKSQALPRGTTLRSTSWWKRVTQESCRSPRLGDVLGETSASPSSTSGGGENDECSNRFDRQMSENLDDNNNNRTEVVYPDNLNIASSKARGNANTMTTQVNVPDWSGSRAPNGSNLNNKERHKTHSLPGVSFGCKISTFRAHNLCPFSLDSSKFTDQVFDSHDKYPSSNSSHNNASTNDNYTLFSTPTSSNKPQSLSSHNGVASTSPHSPLSPPTTARVPANPLPTTPPSTALSDCPVSSTVQPPNRSPLYAPVSTPRPASVTLSYGRTSSLTSPAVHSQSRSPKTSRHPAPQGGKTFTSRLIFAPEKTGLQSEEGRKVIRVTWQDSVDSRHSSEADKVQDSEAAPTASITPAPLFPSRPPRSPSTPFSLLRQRQLSLPSDSVGQTTPRRGGDVDRPSQHSVLDHGGRSAVQNHSPDLSPPPHRCLSYSASSSTSGTEARNTPFFRKTSSPPKPQTTISLTPDSNTTSPISELTSSSLSSDSPPFLSLPFQKETGIVGERLRVVGAAGVDRLNNNNDNDGKLDSVNSYKPVISAKPHLLLPGQGDKAHTHFPSACFRAGDDAASRGTSNSDITDAVDSVTPERLTPVQCVSNGQQVAAETEVNKGPLSEVIGHRPSCATGESCSPEKPPTPGASSVKDSDRLTDVLCQNNSLSETSRSESPLKGLFKGKKRDNVATSSSSTQKQATPLVPNPESERGGGQKGSSNNKMDQVLSRLRQTFRARRIEDDLLASWRARRASPTPTHSDSNSSSSNGEVSRMATASEDLVIRSVTEREPEKNVETEIRYVFLKKRPPPALDPAPPVKDVLFTQKETHESKSQASSSSAHKSERHQPFYKDDLAADSEPAKEFVPRDSSLSAHWQQHPWTPGRSATLPTRARMSSASPGSSPYSPMSSLSSLSPFTPSDDTDDSVFYSPGLRKKSTSGFKLGGEYGPRARASTSTSTSSEALHHQNLDRSSSYSSCADLKYGILAGRSVSVSSVLSSRPSGPGRISTGPSAAGDFPGRMSSVPGGDPGQMRSRSLPRCFSRSRSLSNWSPESPAVPPTPLKTASAAKPRSLWGAGKASTPPFGWDTTGGSLTESPSPPWSPTTRRISMPPSPSSPSSPTSPIIPHDVDSLRSHLPSKAFISSLTSFEESSDSSCSDSTTDDEYYLEPEEVEEKETEL